MTDTIATLVAAHVSGKALPETIEETYDRIARHNDPALFISLRPKDEALAEARRLQDEGPAGKPLFGVPFAVKDNIDVAGLPTTAACPAFAYRPARSAFVIEKLMQAGAIPIGKTNLDQFATGLVGVRSPYGTPRNALRADLIPGGSSSGSAAAVAAGLVPFSLGTDTAGSGRVPAGLNGIVGLKPSLGALSGSGVVPACRTLDTISDLRARRPRRIRRFFRRLRLTTTPTLTRARCPRLCSRRRQRACASAFRAPGSSSSMTTTRRKRPSSAT